jgi:hypothetical protein
VSLTHWYAPIQRSNENHPCCGPVLGPAPASIPAAVMDSPTLSGTPMPGVYAPTPLPSAPSSPRAAARGLLHPIYGTTIYIGRNTVETDAGSFRVLTYQDLIHKGYILALVKGDLERDGNGTVYTRLHSSCVTSGARPPRLLPMPACTSFAQSYPGLRAAHWDTHHAVRGSLCT